ncbi:N-acetyl-alpha-D-glucosaminyl-diphospho-ditrans,octacis-undecaprenol 3-alpha-mannosyltransferase / rhamnosyltransferase [Candidatus Magnetomoraceae bacterium gMMP-15]
MSLRVLHIGKFYPPFAGGIENFMADLLPELQNQGICTAAIVHDNLLPCKKKSIQNGVLIYRVPSFGNIMYAPISPSFPFVLKRAIDDFRPDILHIHLPNVSAFWIMTLAQAKKIPRVIHWHSDVVSSKNMKIALAYNFYRPFEKQLLKGTKQIIATSQPYLQTSIPLSFWKNKCRVVPLGLDVNSLKLPNNDLKKWAENIWQTKKLRVLSVGRLSYYKGHDILIKALKYVSNAKVIIAGKGGERKKLQNLINKSGLEKRIKLIGFVDKSNLNALLASCDCFCLPSVERTEAFGLVLLEAMFFGKPVVASNINGSGVGWVIKHGKTGILVHPGNAYELAKALKIFAENPEYMLKAEKAAISRFNKLFRIEKITLKIIELYREIL